MAWRLRQGQAACGSTGRPVSSRLSRSALVVTAAQSVPVTIKLHKKVLPGESFRLVGNRSFLGKWDPNQGPSLRWSDGDKWAVTTDVPVGSDVEFKILLVKGDKASDWEGGSNRHFKVLGPDYGMEVECTWGQTHNMQFKTFQLNTNHANGASVNDASSAGTASGNDSGSDDPAASPIALVQAEHFALDTCGSKSINCRALEVMIKQLSQTGSTTPTSVCLPFGSLDRALAADPSKAAEAKHLVSQLDSKEGDALDDVCDQLQSLISSLPVPSETLSAISAAFSSPGALLAVRSSPNVEDLAGTPSAGLYESLVGVKAEDPEALRAAVTAVWASLYSQRAVMSRRAASVPQTSAAMAVLVQQLFLPEVSFSLHTLKTTGSETQPAAAGAVSGQGASVGSAGRVAPWRRVEVEEKASGQVSTLAFPNFSRELWRLWWGVW